MTDKFPRATWKSSHVYGEGQKNDLRKLCYWQIPKCASMWMRSYLVQLGQDRYEDIWTAANFTIDNMDGYKSVVLLRDPVERWISACPIREKVAELANKYDDVDSIFENLDDPDNDDVFFGWQNDEHTTPQFSFISGVNLDNAVFFRCDSQLSTNVESFFRSQEFFDHKVSAPVAINVSAEAHDPTIDKAADTWRRILETPRYFWKFQLAHQQDYQLINSVKFYDGQ